MRLHERAFDGGISADRRFHFSSALAVPVVVRHRIRAFAIAACGVMYESSLPTFSSWSSAFSSRAEQAEPVRPDATNAAALSLVRRAWRAVGGEHAWRALATLVVREQIQDFRNHESARPGPPFPFGRRDDVLQVDFRTQQGRLDTRTALPAFPVDATTLWSGERIETLDHRARVRSVRTGDAWSAARAALRRLPQGWLVEAVENVASLRVSAGAPGRGTLVE